MIFHLPKEENGHPARRLYSIVSSPSNTDTLDFIIELIPGGLGSDHIQNMQVGDTMTMQGPAGMFTLKDTGRNIVLLATGTGIAPIYSMIVDRRTQNTEHEPLNIYLFWGMKYKKDIYLKSELDIFANENPHFQYVICLSREEENMDDARCLKGRVNNGLQLISEYNKWNMEDFDFYICGSPHVVESLRDELETQGVPKDHIFFEKFV